MYVGMFARARRTARDAAREHRPVHQHRDPGREPEHEIHVVVDDQDADVGGQGVERVEDDVALGARHAGGRLVEQQHVRPEAERDRELDEALPPVRQLGDAAPRVVRAFFAPRM